MARVFEGTSLVFADPLHPELKEIAAPTLREAVEKNAAIRSAVLERNRALAEAGYHEQVKADGNFTGLFAYRGRSRQALRPADLAGAFSRTSNDEVLKQRGAALMLSPNVLLRPAVQDSIFPTVAYIGGPAEIAYWAQAGAVYAALGRPMPAVFPRISASVIEARIARALRKYGIDLLDVFRGKEFMKRKAVAAVQGVEQFDQARDRITAELESLRPALSSVDPTLGGALETSRQKVLHQVETLRTKYVNAEAKRNESLEKHLDAITSSLYPEKKLQERVLNITSFLVRYGSGFIERLEQALELDSREHQVIEI
jgi:bacillithiol biosynthesis cysteine-adding enzyme BshC